MNCRLIKKSKNLIKQYGMKIKFLNQVFYKIFIFTKKILNQMKKDGGKVYFDFLFFVNF